MSLPITSAPEPNPGDEGGLRPPDDVRGWRRAWWWFHFLILVKLARLRFIALLLVIGLVITQWDWMMAHVERWTGRAVVAESGDPDSEWSCPMHPTIVRDNPRDKCPICFMPLSKRKKSGPAEPLPAGIVNRVQLSPYRVALAGVQTWKVERVALAKEISAVGYVEFNERGEKTVSARVAGRLDKLMVGETGVVVKEGDPLALLYSPELLLSIENLREAQRQGNRPLQESVLTRLTRLGVDQREAKEFLDSNPPPKTLTIRSPMSGHVIKKYVREGQYVLEGTPLYELVDLSTVWVQAQIYEEDLPFLLAPGAPGAPRQPLRVTATTRAFPNQPVEGTLAFIYPHADQESRTVTIRCELENPEHRLRPGGAASVSIRIPPDRLASLAAAVERTSDASPTAEARTALAQGRFLAVPEDAVIDTGRERIVYRQTSPGVFEGVRVVLGPRLMGPEGVEYFPVLEGLNEGERIVGAGSFLVDAETRLNPAAGSIYFGGSGGKTSASSTVRPSTPDDQAAKIAAGLALLPPADRALASEQRTCPVLGTPLGAMGRPHKLTLSGETVFLCCPACEDAAREKPQAVLEKARALKAGRPQNAPARKDGP